MKRKLALFLVLALVLSLVPASVFAASSNEISKIPSIADTTVFTTLTANTPQLRLEETSSGAFDVETFQLILTNAEWNDNASFVTDVQDAIALSAVNATATAVVTRTTDTKIDLEVTFGPVTPNEKASIKVPMITNFDQEGDAKVTVKSIDSALTNGTYTFAVVAGGSTTTTVADTTTFGDSVTSIEPISIEENSIATFGNGLNKTIKLKLTNSDYSWENESDIDVSFSGGFAGATATATIQSNTNELWIHANDLYPVPPTKRGTINITGLSIDPGDASYGDVKVKVYDVAGDMTTETIVVGTYSDYAVTAVADDKDADLPVLYSGDYSSNDDENQLSELIIEEKVADSWNTERKTTITLPEWTHVMAVEVVTADTENWDTNPVPEFDLDGNTVDVTGAWDGDGKIKLGLKIWTSIKADQSGDIVAKISGRGLPSDLSAKLGVAKLPMTVTTEAKDLKIGTQDQPLGKITLTETVEGLLEKDDVIVLPIGDADDFSVGGTVVAKVTKGDLEIKKVETPNNTIVITIDGDSTEPSTIEVTGATVTLDRTVAEGSFDISVEGSLIKNSLNKDYNFDGNAYSDEADAADGGMAFFDQEDIYSAAFAKVITPAPGDTTNVEKVVFTIGAADYMVGAVKMTSDVAPYINEQGRTMLPLRALANALGVTDANIMWNEMERSVTIFKGDATLKVVIGQMSFVKNGVAVPMDTQAVIVNGRTMLPLRAIGQALGAVVTWDEATRTVTVN